ncbi:MAG TPA: hypothetical protein VIN07_13710 [Flavipsychrobacter sp.]
MLKLPVILICLLQTTVCSAQYYPEHGIRIVDSNYVPSAKYITTEVLSNSYCREGLPAIFDELYAALEKHGGNVASIYTYSYKRGIRNVNTVFADIWITKDAEHMDLIPENQYFDSIKRELTKGEKAISHLIILSAPHKPSSDMGVAIINVQLNSTAEKELCAMQQYAFCDFILEKEAKIILTTYYNASDRGKAGFPANTMKDDDFIININPGDIYCLAYLKKSYTRGEIFALPFNIGYRLYRWYAMKHE